MHGQCECSHAQQVKELDKKVRTVPHIVFINLLSSPFLSMLHSRPQACDMEVCGALV